MNRNLIALAVTVTLAAGTAAAFAATEAYSDVSSNWAQTDINTMVNQKVMTGFNDGKFHPDAWVTRTEFTQMAAKTLNLPASKADTVPSFKNVSNNSWAFTKVENQAWISSYPTGVFRPANPLRRVEALAGLAGALNKPLVSEEESNTILGKYTDANEVPATVRKEVATAIKYNLFEIDPKSGTDKIEPLRPATRAEVAALLNDLHENRDIAIVQNGQLVSASSQTTTSESSMTSTTTTTPETSADANVGASTSTPETSANANINATTSTGSTSTSTSAETTTTPSTTSTGTSMVRETESTETTTTTSDNTSTQSGQTTAESQTNTGYQQGTANQSTTSDNSQTAGNHIDFMQGRGTPYRNSADTIPEFRTVNTTSSPTNLDAQAAANLPANTTFTGTVAKSLYTAYNKPGDPVMVILDHPLYDAGGKVVAPAGSKLLGLVTSVISKNESGDTPKLGLTFNGFITPDGQRIPINATINNTDGVLKAGELQGVVFHPNHSTEALKREISASAGSLYGTKAGKAYVLEEPLAYQVSDRPVDAMDINADSDIVLGVGDRLQLRVGSGSTTEQNNTNNQ